MVPDQWMLLRCPSFAPALRLLRTGLRVPHTMRGCEAVHDAQGVATPLLLRRQVVVGCVSVAKLRGPAGLGQSSTREYGRLHRRGLVKDPVDVPVDRRFQ